MWRRVGCIVLPILGAALSALTLYLIVIRPASRVRVAKQWTATPCRIVSSNVADVTRPGSTSLYKADIRYRYVFRGGEYVGNRYDLMGDSGTRYREPQLRIVERYKPGMATTCYVNPAAPQESVLHRAYPRGMWWGILPVLFLFFSVLGLVVAVFMNE